MATIDIYQQTIETIDEDMRSSSYRALSATRGQLVCRITGDIAIVNDGYADMAIVDGQTWALRDAIAMARRGDHGLIIVE